MVDESIYLPSEKRSTTVNIAKETKNNPNPNPNPNPNQKQKQKQKKKKKTKVKNNDDNNTNENNENSENNNNNNSNKKKKKKKNSSKNKNKNIAKPYSMFPALHQRVVDALADEISPTPWFKGQDSSGSSNRGSNKEYATNVMGKFRCWSNACPAGVWSSKKVAILIRGYPRNGYDAQVFNQRCRSCDRLGVLTLDEDSYVERITFRLRRWAGVQVEPQEYSRSKEGPPHERNLCEGCKRGICRWDYE